MASNWYDTFDGTSDCLSAAERDEWADFTQHDAVITWTLWDTVSKNTEILHMEQIGNDSVIKAADDMRLTLGSGDDFYIYDDGTNILKISYEGGNRTEIKGPNDGGDGVYIKANQVDTYPYMHQYLYLE